ncbi:MAG: AbrB/MazE/SpoVT family DNA-binding domain-containing protein [Chitinivibrionales bacterium]|nr:AbrB/MazE/SpoVT family DNA-binding domain-containing protein [Chitinivibrionales bacterium]
MSTATITSKGQVTLPKEMRRKLHLEAGEKIDFRVDEEMGTATLVPLNKHVGDVFGVMHRPGRSKHVTAEDMHMAIKEKIRREYL